MDTRHEGGGVARGSKYRRTRSLRSGICALRGLSNARGASTKNKRSTEPRRKHPVGTRSTKRI
eukprot:4861141-Alexandrium_andersonii.AAC.1